MVTYVDFLSSLVDSTLLNLFQKPHSTSCRSLLPANPQLIHPRCLKDLFPSSLALFMFLC